MLLEKLAPRGSEHLASHRPLSNCARTCLKSCLKSQDKTPAKQGEREKDPRPVVRTAGASGWGHDPDRWSNTMGARRRLQHPQESCNHKSAHGYLPKYAVSVELSYAHRISYSCQPVGPISTGPGVVTSSTVGSVGGKSAGTLPVKIMAWVEQTSVVRTAKMTTGTSRRVRSRRMNGRVWCR